MTLQHTTQINITCRQKGCQSRIGMLVASAAVGPTYKTIEGVLAQAATELKWKHYVDGDGVSTGWTCEVHS